MFKVIHFLLVPVTNIEFMKSNISFLGIFSFTKDILRYNNLSSYSFNT